MANVNDHGKPSQQFPLEWGGQGEAGVDGVLLLVAEDCLDGPWVGPRKIHKIQEIPQTFIVHPKTLGHKGLQGPTIPTVPARAAAHTSLLQTAHSFPPRQVRRWGGEEVG